MSQIDAMMHLPCLGLGSLAKLLRPKNAASTFYVISTNTANCEFWRCDISQYPAKALPVTWLFTKYNSRKFTKIHVKSSWFLRQSQPSLSLLSAILSSNFARHHASSESEGIGDCSSSILKWRMATGELTLSEVAVVWVSRLLH